MENYKTKLTFWNIADICTLFFIAYITLKVKNIILIVLTCLGGCIYAYYIVPEFGFLLKMETIYTVGNLMFLNYLAYIALKVKNIMALLVLVFIGCYFGFYIISEKHQVNSKARGINDEVILFLLGNIAINVRNVWLTTGICVIGCAYATFCVKRHF